MEGEFRAGVFEAPNGDEVRVFRAFSGEWGCVVAPPRSRRVTARELTPAFWEVLRPKPLPGNA